MKTCSSGHEYDENDPEAVAYHTEPYDCESSCRRCPGRPRCYACGSSFCFCAGH